MTRPAYLGPLAMRTIVRADWMPVPAWPSGGAWIEILSCGHAGAGTGPGSVRVHLGGRPMPATRRHCSRCVNEVQA